MVGNLAKTGFIADKEWQAPQWNAFQQLIDAFISAPVLRHYDPAGRLPPNARGQWKGEA